MFSDSMVTDKVLELVDSCLRGEVWNKEDLKNLRMSLVGLKHHTAELLQELPDDVRMSIQQLIDPKPPELTMGGRSDRLQIWPSPGAQYPLKVRKEFKRALRQPGYNSFDLQTITGGHALSCVYYFILEEEGLLDKLGLNRSKAQAFALVVESMYLDKPYHNAVHACNVLLMMYHLIHHCNILDTLAIPLDLVLVSAYTACIVHDISHPGVTNALLIKTNDARAQRFHDQSVTENFHLQQFFEVVKQPQYALFDQLDKESWSYVRHLVINMVLRTDMQYHLEVVHQFQEITGPIPHVLLMQVSLKVADLQHTTLEWDLHNRWVGLLQQEFFLQGDVEKQLGLPVSALMDRDHEGITVSQVGFFALIVFPLLEAFMTKFPNGAGLLERARSNKDIWSKQL